jgi:hypothetical protein
MKKLLFCMMAVVALAFTACEPTPDPNGGETPNTGDVTMTLNQTDVQLVIGSKVTLRPVLNPAPTGEYTISWTSSNESVATVKNGAVTAISEGSAVITATLDGTDVKATANVSVVNAYDGVTFYDAQLWGTFEGREYPYKGYRLDEATGDTIWVTDVNGDGIDDMVRELYLYVLGNGLYIDGNALTGESDYLIYVKSAGVYDGKYYYCIGDYTFSDDKDVYTRTREGVEYLRPTYATYSHFVPASYCKYYENVLTADANGQTWPATQEEYDQFIAEYGYWLGDHDSFLRYFVNDSEQPYFAFAGLISGGEGFEWVIEDENTGATKIGYMDLEIDFFDNTAMGFATQEVDGQLGFKVPLEMAPFYNRHIRFGERQPQQVAAKNAVNALPGRISETQMMVNRITNIALNSFMR